jgi:beta-galactosidase
MSTTRVPPGPDFGYNSALTRDKAGGETMKKSFGVILSIAILLIWRPGPAAARCGQAPDGGTEGRETILLDQGWRFALGHAADPAGDFRYGLGAPYAKVDSWEGAVRTDFDDSSWRLIDLPHDWAIELPFVRAPYSEDLMDHGFKPVGRAFPETSVGWYRRRFSVPAGDAGRRIRLDFGGVFRDCQVWLNGLLLGRHEGGYSPFVFDATDCVRCGGENVLVLRVDATQKEGWFYEGAGIYRHVRLIKTAAVHIPPLGTSVAAKVVDGNSAVVGIFTEIANESGRAANVRLKTVILDPSGKAVGESISAETAVGPWETATLSQSVKVEKPVLWSLGNPALYQAVSTARTDGADVDETVTRFGIRTIRFDKDRGFFLNGEPVEIRGVCCHQDHAGVGAAVPDALQRYRVAKLKDMGVNAYRASHNAPAPEILDVCDELGMLVMDEQRLFSSNETSLDQLRRMVRRDRNHPSIILWSVGNEEESVQGQEVGRRIAETMTRTVKALDTTRPVTYASNSGYYEGINKIMDVRGFNYHMDEIDRYRTAHPDQPLYGSEIASTLTTRGEYADDESRGYLQAYDKHKPAWGELAEEWMTFYRARPWLAGAFIWTGFDYRGEPTPYDWPCISSHFGILDTCGFPKDLFWYYKSWWTPEPVLHILPHWNWKGKEGRPVSVWVYTNMEEVRLKLNGKDLGLKKVPKLGHVEWLVPYKPGRLETIGYRNGKLAGRAVVETTGEPSRLALTADRTVISADGGDVSIISVGALDSKGRPVPEAADDVAFDLEGPGRIIGVGNGDPSSHEPDAFIEKGARWHRRLFNGLAQVIVRSGGTPGTIVLKATAPGVDSATLTIQSR